MTKKVVEIKHCNKKHPCPDCKSCQFCSDRRCELCQGWLVKNGKSDTSIPDNGTQHRKEDDGQSQH